jgi:1,4-alpha-glucan branching enzyme
VVGDFNNWDGRVHPMRKLLGSGVWELFLPTVGENAHYKFEIRTPRGALLLKSDPFAFFNQHGIDTSSLVYDLERYQWNDQEWMASRATRDWPNSPISIYEVHLGSWRRRTDEGNRFLSYLEFAETLLPYVLEMGYTHMELLPIAEHPFEGSWGYQVTNYYAPTSRFGTPDELRHFIDKCHQAGIGVIMDWVPAHFPKDAHGLAEFDGTDLYEHADPRQGVHPDWHTYVFNYGRNEVQSFLLSSALFWLDVYHADSLRVDAVASMLYLDYSRQPGTWIPNIQGGRENLEAIAFLRRFNQTVYQRYPDVHTIAEESTAWPMVSRPASVGGLGFGLKWDMGWMHDMLDYMHHDPIHRKFHHNALTFRLLYAFNENFVLPLSHDEVVYGKGALLSKMPGNDRQQYANLRLLLGYMYAQPGKKLLFMGGEFGQWREWNHEASLDWHLLESAPHAGLQQWVMDLNEFYRQTPALYEGDCEPGGFAWIECNDAESSVVSFLRQGQTSQAPLLVVCNFTPVQRQNYRVGAPYGGVWCEVLNSDARTYGGSGYGNLGAVEAAPVPYQGRPYSLTLLVPPLAVVFFTSLPGERA